MSWLSTIIKDLLIGLLNWWNGLRNVELREKAESYVEALKQKTKSEKEAIKLEAQIMNRMKEIGNIDPEYNNDDILGSKEWNQ